MGKIARIALACAALALVAPAAAPLAGDPGHQFVTASGSDSFIDEVAPGHSQPPTPEAEAETEGFPLAVTRQNVDSNGPASRDAVREHVAPQAAVEPDWNLAVDGYCGEWSCIQSAVDSSDLAYIDFGIGLVEIAGHSHGPAGVIAKMSVGDTVAVSGHGAGTYRIVSQVVVPKQTPINGVPEGMAFQTCVGDQLLLQYVESVGH